MNIIFLTHSSDQGHRFRVEQYFPLLRHRGVWPLWQPLPASIQDRFSIYMRLPQYDLVFIQRRLLSPIEFSWIRRKSKKILFDLDDAIMYRSSSSPKPRSLSRWVKFKWMVKKSDAVIAGNSFLREEVLRADPRKNVSVIPTPVDLRAYPLKKEPTSSSPLIIGWMGTKGNLRYLQKLEPVFRTLASRFPNLALKIVSDGHFESRFLPTINKPWALEEENLDLISFDIGVMPLQDHPWSRGKCGVKILQYLSVGLPVVCSPVGMNRDIIKPGVNGFWAETEEEWVRHLETLLEDPGMRREMGRQGIETVKEGYCIEVCFHQLYQVLQSLIGGRAIC
ncbi:MAG: glycosyltransferase family 4 protein [Desulfobacterota bacterium]|nr:glycosyltransferase family 4 protein [Thermodesulfobacteriota bacterium]